MSPVPSRNGRPGSRWGLRLPFNRTYELTLVDRRPIAEKMLRVTLSGFNLERFRYQGGDQRCTLLIPWAEDEAWRDMLPASADPWTAASQWGFVAGLTRPLRRQLTVSGYRAEKLEIDFDILLHGDSPLGNWAQHTPLGSAVEVIDNGRRYHVSDETRWQLLIADEAGAPAALAIAAQTPEAVPTTLYIPNTAIVSSAHTPSDHVTVIPMPTQSADRTSGQMFASAVLADRLPVARDQIGIAGEHAFAHTLVTSLHRAGVPRNTIHAGSYWKLQ